ncbi:MAG TPA: hypothetical protein VM425_02155 [Myxococcota bacterium]|nr:hypothetical protein [Myxococcota bacterium]
MRMSGFLSVALLVLLAAPASGQWYDTSEVPGGVGDIIPPFTLKGFNLGSGGEVSSWLAPGTDPKVTAISTLIRGGFTFSDMPLYLGLEVPLSYYTADNSSQFVIGNVGLGVKYRLDPFEKSLEIYTGWSLDVYLPTAWIDNKDIGTALKQMTAHGFGVMNSLMPGLNIPESLAIVATFDVVKPGQIVYFQAEISPAVYIPVSDTDTRETSGAFIWAAAAGIHIIDEVAFLLEFKGYTPINVEGASTFMAISPGFRLKFGFFEPAIWVSIPLDSDYRNASPDVIVGFDLSFWF